MTKTVSNSDICFIKVMLLLSELGHFSLNFASHGSSPPLIQLRLKALAAWPLKSFTFLSTNDLCLFYFGTTKFKNDANRHI